MLTHLPTPLARGRGVPPHDEPQHLGAAIAGATIFDLLAISTRLPPASLRPPWVAVLRAGPRLNAWPHCAALHSGPNFATLSEQSGCAPGGLQDSRQALTANGRQRPAKAADGHLRACRQALHVITVVS